jgi:ESCRT-I complex subunit TSG101
MPPPPQYPTSPTNQPQYLNTPTNPPPQYSGPTNPPPPQYSGQPNSTPPPYPRQNSPPPQYPPQNGHAKKPLPPVPPPVPPPPYPTWQTPSQPPPPYQPPPEYQPPKQPTEDPAVVLRRNTLNSLVEKTKKQLQEFYTDATKDIETYMAESANINGISTILEDEKVRILREIEQAEQEAKAIGDKIAESDKWLQENDKPDTQIDYDAITDPKDALTKQLLYLVAEDATIEDTLYYLDKALNSGLLELDAYLKTIRLLSRQQFQVRAVIKKVHEAQHSRPRS